MCTSVSSPLASSTETISRLQAEVGCKREDQSGRRTVALNAKTHAATATRALLDEQRDRLGFAGCDVQRGRRTRNRKAEGARVGVLEQLQHGVHDSLLQRFLVQVSWRRGVGEVGRYRAILVQRPLVLRHFGQNRLPLHGASRIADAPRALGAAAVVLEREARVIGADPAEAAAYGAGAEIFVPVWAPSIAIDPVQQAGCRPTDR